MGGWLWGEGGVGWEGREGVMGGIRFAVWNSEFGRGLFGGEGVVDSLLRQGGREIYL